MISVIVVTYNQERTIGRTLDSILAQECSQDVEIVIGEDCSTDGTRAVCRRYASKYPDRIRLICNERNKGVVDNYFDCLLECRGEYIADCAGDDFWTDTLKLEKEARVLDGNPEVTLVHTDWVVHDEESGVTALSGKQEFASPLTDGKAMLVAMVTQRERPVVHLCTALYRRSVLMEAYRENEFLFRNADFGCEDLQICFVMALRGVIAYIPEITLCYSRGGISVSNSADERRQFLFVKRITELSFYLSCTYGVSDSDVTDYFRDRIHALSMHAFRAQDKELRDDVMLLQTRYGIRPYVRTRLLHAMTSCRLLWRIGYAVRCLLVKFKDSAKLRLNLFSYAAL